MIFARKMKLITPEEMVRRVNFRVKLVRFCALIAVVLLFVWGFSPFYKLSFNSSSSIKGTVFIIEKNASLGKGDLGAFWPPSNIFYKNIWFTKQVVGMAGDYVSYKPMAGGTYVFVNDINLGLVKAHSLDGVTVEAGASGVIPFGYYFFWTAHPDSFDSRYAQVGLIHESQIIGRATRLL